MPIVKLLCEALPHPLRTLWFALCTASTIPLSEIPRALLLCTVTCRVPTVPIVFTVPCLT